MNLPNLALTRLYGNQGLVRDKLAGRRTVLVKAAGLYSPPTPVQEPATTFAPSELGELAKIAAACGMELADGEKQASPIVRVPGALPRFPIGVNPVAKGGATPRPPKVAQPKAPPTAPTPNSLASTPKPVGGSNVGGPGGKPTTMTLPKQPDPPAQKTPPAPPAGASPGNAPTGAPGGLPEPPSIAPKAPNFIGAMQKHLPGLLPALSIAGAGYGAYKLMNKGLDMLGSESSGAPRWGSGYPAMAWGNNQYGEAQLGTPVQF